MKYLTQILAIWFGVSVVVAAGPVTITINSVQSGQNDLQVLDLSPITTGVDRNSISTENYVNLTGTLFTDYHFEVPKPAGLGDFVWEDLNEEDFSSDSFFDIFFEVTIDNSLLVDFYIGDGPGIAAGSSYQIAIRNNLSDGDIEASSYPTVPEPSILTLLGLGLAGLGYQRRKRMNG